MRGTGKAEVYVHLQIHADMNEGGRSEKGSELLSFSSFFHLSGWLGVSSFLLLPRALHAPLLSYLNWSFLTPSIGREALYKGSQSSFSWRRFFEGVNIHVYRRMNAYPYMKMFAWIYTYLRMHAQECMDLDRCRKNFSQKRESLLSSLFCLSSSSSSRLS